MYNYSNAPVVGRYGQVRCFSEQEMMRRLQATRTVMAQNGISLLLILDGYWEGYIQWLAGVRNVQYALISMEGPMYLVFSQRDAFFAPSEGIELPYGVDAIIVNRLEDVPRSFLSGTQTNGLLGFIHLEAMTVKLRSFLEQVAPAAQAVDITALLDPVKATKSQEELAEIEHTVALHEKVLAALPSIIAPGRMILRVDQDMRALCRQLGSGDGECLSLTLQWGNSRTGALRKREGFQPWPDERLQWGDMLLVLLETNGRAGHFSALGRYFSLGSTTDEDEKYWALALKMQDFAAARLKPGSKLLDIYNANVQYIRSLGADTLPRNYLHSLGYCFGEKPFLFDDTQNVPLRENMVYIVHPYVRFSRLNRLGQPEDDEMCAIDTYRVTPEGGIRQNKAPRTIVVING